MPERPGMSCSSANAPVRIVILTTEDVFSNLISERLIREFPRQVAGIIRSDSLVRGKRPHQALLYFLRRSGLHFTFTRIWKRAQLRALFFASKLFPVRTRIKSLQALGRQYGVPLMGSFDVNSRQSLEHVCSWHPDLLVSVHLNQHIKSPLMGLAARGVLNIHPSLLPRHRGPMPVFSVLANGDGETGVSVHWVDEGLDTGPLILQERICVEPDDTILSLSFKAAVAGAEVLVKAIRLLSEGSAPCVVQDKSCASYHPMPTRVDQKRFRQKGRRYGSVLALLKSLRKMNTRSAASL